MTMERGSEKERKRERGREEFVSPNRAKSLKNGKNSTFKKADF
jgi:hypothetical protein